MQEPTGQRGRHADGHEEPAGEPVAPTPPPSGPTEAAAAGRGAVTVATADRSAPPGPVDVVGAGTFPSPTFGQRWGNLIATVVLLVVGALVLSWLVQRNRPAAIEVDGSPIVNAAAMLDEAEAAFDQLVADDGAHPPAGAGCWFVPVADSGPGAPGRPHITCGPVRLGVSHGGEDWVAAGTVYASLTVGSEHQVTGRFTGLRDLEAVDPAVLVRPDGASPPPGTGLAPPDPLLREEGGQRLLGDGAVLDTVERALPAAARRSNALLGPDAGCWYGVQPGERGERISDGALWCGPMLLATSSPGEVWARVPLSIQQGESFALARVRAAPPVSIPGTQQLTPGTQLYRPDGRPPPAGAPASDPGGGGARVEVLAAIPTDLSLRRPVGDGRLVVPGRDLTLDGLARVPRVGALVALPGEELLVARFRRADRPVTGPASSAQVLVAGRRTALDRWPSLPERGLLVVSVPGGTDALLEVRFDGVAQTISVATGVRGPGARAALYRPVRDVPVGRRIGAMVPLPAGPPATASGQLRAVQLDAWRPGPGWAAPGRAYVALALDGWREQAPCCALKGVEVIVTWALALPDGTVVAARPAAAPGEIVFDVPETITLAEVRLTTAATYDQQGVPGVATGFPVSVPVGLPA